MRPLKNAVSFKTSPTNLGMDSGVTVTQARGGHAVHPGLGAMGGLSTLVRTGHHLIPHHQR